MTACAFCGRENDASVGFCADCGKPLSPSAAAILSPEAVRAAAASLEAKRASAASASRADAGAATSAARRNSHTARCPRCGGDIDPRLPFCAHCGERTGAPVVAATPPRGTVVVNGGDRGSEARLALLDERGGVVRTYALSPGEIVVGRGDGDIVLSDDVYLSPVHAQFSLRDGELRVRDLGSRNGTWAFLDDPHRLLDGDVTLVGSQLLRFRRLGYPGPHPPEADRTRRLGSLVPTADIAMLGQLRADGSVRDTFHLSPGRNIIIGRDSGDWVFPYDQTMSATHAEVRSEDSDFFVADAGSRNGIAIAVRGERQLAAGNRVLVGDRILRVEQL